MQAQQLHCLHVHLVQYPFDPHQTGSSEGEDYISRLEEIDDVALVGDDLLLSSGALPPDDDTAVSITLSPVTYYWVSPDWLIIVCLLTNLYPGTSRCFLFNVKYFYR